MVRKIRRTIGERKEAARQYGPRPEVQLEHTNYGPQMDRVVERARRNQRVLGVNDDYDLVREHFDHYQFMLQATTLQEEPETDPIRFFLRNGPRAVNSPDPHFSMTNYLARYPQYAGGPERSPYLEWLKRGKAAGEIADPAHGIELMAEVLGLEPAQIVAELVAVRDDMNERLRYGVLGEMFAKAAEIEPLIGASWVETTRVRQVPLGAKHVASQIALLHHCHRAADFTRARLVMVINRPRWGGGRRIEGHLAHAVTGGIKPEEIVVIYTDEGGRAPVGRYPVGVRELDLATKGQELGLPDDAQAQALIVLLRSFRADSIININSRLLYRAMLPYGKALAASERLYLCFFNNEQRAQGNWEGWSLKWFYAAFDYLAGVITDSESLRDYLAEMYQVPEAEMERVHVLRAPAPTDIPVAPRPAAGGRPVVFWAGRFDRQKRIDLVLEIARAMPDVTFRLWGERVLQGDPLGAVPENVEIRPPFAGFGSLDLSEADAWLYTSAWDGVPNMLLEVAMTGVPLVGTVVGGTGEVLAEDGAWPVTDVDDVAAYQKALREIFADADAARAKSLRLRERMLSARTAETFGEQATALLLPGGHKSEVADQ